MSGVCAILGLGTATPDHSFAQEDALELALRLSPAETEDARRQVELIYRRSGVSQRGTAAASALRLGQSQNEGGFSPSSLAQPFGPGTAERMAIYARHAGELSKRSASAALARSGVDPAEITHLVTASCTGFAAPGWDIELIESQRLAPSVQRTNVGFMGCHAAMNALRVADAFVRADTHAKVLLCCTEICSAHFRYGAKPDQVVANALFADGSASVVLGRCGDSTALPRIGSTSSFIVPGTRDQMSWAVGDHGFEMNLGIELPGTIRRSAGPWLEGWLGTQGLRVADIGTWAVHPGGPKILQSVAEAMSLPAGSLDLSKSVLAAYGNMSSPTVLFILGRVLERAALTSPCVMLSFGPGITAEAALLTP